MKNLRKTGCLAALGVLLCLCIFYSTSLKGVYAKAKPKLSRKNITMEMDSSRTLTLKNAPSRVKWSVSNKNLLTITGTSGRRKNTVTFHSSIKSGKCTIRAKVGRKTYSCKVTVKLSKGAQPKKYKNPKVVVSNVAKQSNDYVLRVEVQNGKNEAIGYETSYTLQKYVGGTWQTIPKKADYRHWPSWICFQYPYTAYIYNVSLKTDYDVSQLTAGKYRMYMDISYFKQNQRYAEFNL